MYNPNTQIPKDGQDVGTAPQNNLNDPNFYTNQGSNTFTLSFQNLITARYGEITPYNYLTCIGRDRIRLNSSHDLRSYTLQSPLMSSLRMRKSNFSIPISAIMPNTYNYLKVNPVKGSDVPDDAYCFVDLVRLVYSISQQISTTEDLNIRLKYFLLLYLFFSKGSLLDYLGISFSGILPDKMEVYDSVFDSVDSLFDKIVGLCVNENTDYLNTQFFIKYRTTDYTTGHGETRDTILTGGSLPAVRDCFLTMFEHPDFELSIGDTLSEAIVPYITDFASFLNAYLRRFIFDVNGSGELSSSYRPFNVNIYKLIAYQMVCAQFYTNDNVDNVYNSDLWLNNQRSLIDTIVPSDDQYFHYNGVKVRYDIFSNHMLTLNGVAYDLKATSADNVLNYVYFWINLLSFRRSLRYGDYFNGARTQPLAVGNVDVPVVGNNVSVIDINRNLHMQRFLNAVNRTKSTIYDYCRGIFGYTPTKLNPTPSCISTETLFVGSDEIENTAQEQGTVNTNLRAAQSHFEYDVTLTDDCIILGLISFECTSSYDKSVERDNFHINRFDEYIPELQHIGDQEVYPVERNARDFHRLSAFGYQVRYAEYKFKFNQMHGGFTYNLPSWAFVTDVDRTEHLDEDSIRSYPAEFDKFYKSLTNSSLAGYYHFVISFANNIDANRPMDYQPRLL